MVRCAISKWSKPALAGEKTGVVVVATDITHHEHFMSSFRFTLWSVVVRCARTLAPLGWMSPESGLAPLHAIKREAGCHYGGSAASTDCQPMISRSSWWIWPIP